MASLPCKTLQRNGVSIAYVSKRDVAFLYREIEEKDCYFQHGISLPRGGTVIDVGANIGIFAAHAARKVSSKGRVIACEPLPATFAALQYNMKSTLNAGMHSSMLPNCPASGNQVILLLCMAAVQSMTYFADDGVACVQVMRRSRSSSAGLEMAQHLKLTLRCTRQPQARLKLSCELLSMPCVCSIDVLPIAAFCRTLRCAILTHHQTEYRQLVLLMIGLSMALHKYISNTLCSIILTLKRKYRMEHHVP